MKNKRKKKHLVLYIALFLILFLLSTLFMPFSLTGKSNTAEEGNIMSEALEGKNPVISEIAMLGAHDAFSSGISYDSSSDYNEGGIVTNKAVNAIAKGLVVRMSKAQKADASELLYAGVRYFDVRVSLIDGVYYTVHGYISSTLESYLKETVDFIDEHPGEFIIFDIQHFYTESGSNYSLSDTDYLELFTFIDSVKSDEGHSLLDFVHYNSLSDDLSSLTYNIVTGNALAGGAVITIKNDSISYAFDRDGEQSEKESVRSLWHNDNKTSIMIDEIGKEAAYIESNYTELEGELRVNQAQKTGFIMNAKLVRSLFSWSILDMAASFNKELVKDEERFTAWLHAMPIVMVDYADSNNGDFNTQVNQLIKSYNESL